MQRTRYYPRAIEDPETGKPSARGPICRLCTHKFFVWEGVNETHKHINATKISMVEGQKRLIIAGSEAKNEVHDEEDANQFQAQKIEEAEQEN